MMELHTTGDNLRRTMPLYETERQLNRTTAGSRAVFSSRQQSFSHIIDIEHIISVGYSTIGIIPSGLGFETGSAKSVISKY